MNHLINGGKMEHKCVLTGPAIVVLDRGFVYVGIVTVDGDWCRIESAKNIRVWGTTQGLGELVNGPTKSTKLDSVGSIRAPMRAVISIIDVDTEKWKSVF
ncbi:MAG: hypothetical protein ACYDB1_00620 [Acidiferrobacteraceae bacterium]